MQTELTELGIDVQILGINDAGYESGLSAMSDMGDLPLLQDTEDVAAWDLWDVTYRDVYVLTPDNELHGVFNLTGHSLETDANYEALIDLFVGAAAR
jgi:hypothetical protein